MAISNKTSQIAANALQAIPLSSMIGGPLKACIEAQAMAANTTWDFIKEVGLTTDPVTGERSTAYIAFSFMQNGRMVQLNVPLLTIVPVPYFTINSVDLNFKASISAASSCVTENAESTLRSAGGEMQVGGNVGPFHVDAQLNANFSSKKDSKATEESKYCVEYTMDISVKAGQDSMPAGLAKVLELLGNTIDISDPKGTLEVNALAFEPGERLVATYKNKTGLYAPEEITCTNTATHEVLLLEGEGNNAVAQLDQPGTYVLEAGQQKLSIVVSGEQPQEVKEAGAKTKK